MRDTFFEKTEPETIPGTIEDEGVIKVYYAKDENGDKIPDKYQATVTFKVVMVVGMMAARMTRNAL